MEIVELAEIVGFWFVNQLTHHRVIRRTREKPKELEVLRIDEGQPTPDNTFIGNYQWDEKSMEKDWLFWKLCFHDGGAYLTNALAEAILYLLEQRGYTMRQNKDVFHIFHYS